MRRTIALGYAGDHPGVQRVALLRPVDGDPVRLPAFFEDDAIGVGHHLSYPLVCSTPRLLERFPAKWTPVRVKKTRQNNKLEPSSDTIVTENAHATHMRARAYV